MKEREHELRLKQELRRLKEEDIAKLRERQKRLELKRKIEIITKHTKDTELREEVKRREQILAVTRFENNIKTNKEKINMTLDVQAMIKEGFRTDHGNKKKR